MSKTQIVKRALAIVSFIFASLGANASELSANVGWNSEYIFRGVPQSDSSAFAGLDVEHSGFYLGTWVADVGEGVEADIYGGYGGEFAGFRYGVGVTAYLYTDDFDDEYIEVNIIGGYGLLSVDIAVGEYKNFAGPTLDYQYYTLAGEYNNIYASVSVWDDAYKGEVIEVGYANNLSIKDTELFDYRIAAIHSNNVGIRDLADGDDDTSFVLSISKAFGTE